MIARMSLKLHQLSVVMPILTVALLTQTTCLSAKDERKPNAASQAAVPEAANSETARAGDGRGSGKEHSLTGHPSPLLSLHERGQAYDKLVSPATAAFPLLGGEIKRRYSNGAMARFERTARGSFMLHTVTRGKDVAGKDTWVVGPGERIGR